uniref:Mucolipin-3 n=1 Tax=Cacopsylla melanoneura TaxID=428564 RepID=A0A8D9DUZ5_9HEMI
MMDAPRDGEGTSKDTTHTNWANTTEDDGLLDAEMASSPMSGNGQRVMLSEDIMRRKLQFFFMNPIQKWKAKKRFPYKFLIQLIKIVLVTLQLCLFAQNRYSHVNYAWDNRVAFSHLFIKGWDPTREVSSYPPALGPLAIYYQDTFYSTIDYAVNGYANLSNAIGPYSYTEENNTMDSLTFCVYQFKEGNIFGFNESFTFNSDIEQNCTELNITETTRITGYDSKAELENIDREIEFSRFVKAELFISVKTVNFKAAGPISPPDCYQFDIIIKLDNADMDGQVLITLDAEATRLDCKGDTHYYDNNSLDFILRSILNFLVILVCCTSFILCTRAIWRAQLLKYETIYFFREKFNKELTMEGRLEFLNLWYVMIIANDALLILGSSIKEQIERKQFIGDQWNLCSVFLGTGNLLVWFGVLRYLGFFKTYNVVILTLKKAFPKVARFLLCAVLIYAGFTFCGWLVLGPYHMKFKSLSTTSECLFALINGDDMFATFFIMPHKSAMLWWYLRFYLYSFTSLYIYVILSLFISVIMDAYETIKEYYIHGFPKSDVMKFMGEIQDEETTHDFWSSIETASFSFREQLHKMVCCNSCRK